MVGGRRVGPFLAMELWRRRLGTTSWTLTISNGCNTIRNTLRLLVATRTVRLDDEAETALRQIRDATGLPISEALKQGLQALKQRVSEQSGRRPYDLYQSLDLGPGGYAVAPSTDTRRGVVAALRKKLRR